MVVAICLACMLLDRIANIKTLENIIMGTFHSTKSRPKVQFSFPYHLPLFQKFWNFWLDGKCSLYCILPSEINYHGIPWNLNGILVPSLFSTAQMADAFLWFPLHKTASNIAVLSWVSTDRFLTQS